MFSRRRRTYGNLPNHTLQENCRDNTIYESRSEMENSLTKGFLQFFFDNVPFLLLTLKASFVALRNAFLLIFEYVSVQSGGFCFLWFKKVFSYVDFPGSRRARTFVSPSVILLPATIDRSTGLETQQTYIFLESTHQELFKNIYFDGSTSSLK